MFGYHKELLGITEDSSCLYKPNGKRNLDVPIATKGSETFECKVHSAHDYLVAWQPKRNLTVRYKNSRRSERVTHQLIAATIEHQHAQQERGEHCSYCFIFVIF
jgi:hypothetical protein